MYPLCHHICYLECLFLYLAIFLAPQELFFRGLGKPPSKVEITYLKKIVSVSVIECSFESNIPKF